MFSQVLKFNGHFFVVVVNIITLSRDADTDVSRLLRFSITHTDSSTGYIFFKRILNIEIFQKSRTDFQSSGIPAPNLYFMVKQLRGCHKNFRAFSKLTELQIVAWAPKSLAKTKEIS